MTTKTITVTEKAYQALHRLKEEDESFSELFHRLSKRHLTATDIIGTLQESTDEETAFTKRVTAAHQAVSQGLMRRRKNVHS